MAQKYYAVRRGRVPGIYDNWQEWNAQVSRFSNSESKSFWELADAEAYMAAAGFSCSAPAPAPAPAAYVYAPPPAVPAYVPVQAYPPAYAPAPPLYAPNPVYVAPPPAPAPKRPRPEEELEEVVLFCDGACKRNPGPGGWAYAMVLPPALSPDGWYQLQTESRYQSETTNNRMELWGAISGLNAVSRALGPGVRVRIYVDSHYVEKGIKKLVPKWKQNGWRTSRKTEVLNRDLWEELDAAAEPHVLEWIPVPGHSGVPGNALVDRLAKAASRDGCASFNVESYDEAPDILEVPDTPLRPARPPKRTRRRGQQ